MSDKDVVPLVGLTGRARAGKDTVASFLVAAGWKQVSFAEPMREFVASLVGCTVEELGETGFKERPHPALGGKSPRYAMQTLGTEWGRFTIDPDLWLNRAMRRATELRFEGFPVVISDIRLDREAEAVIAAGGRVFKVTRPGVAIEESGHITEAGINQSLISGEFNNSGNFQQLARTIVKVLDIPDGHKAGSSAGISRKANENRTALARG